MTGQQVKEIRTSLGLSQTKFAKPLGVSGAAISLLELGDRQITDQMKNLICMTYKVDPIWLQTGKGMPTPSAEDDLDNVLDFFLVDEKETAKAVIKTLAKLGGVEWRAFKTVILDLAHAIEQAEQTNK